MLFRSLDVAPCRLHGDAQILSQAEVGDAVDDAEVHGLGRAALLLGHLLEGGVEHLSRRAPMDVRPGVEGVDQVFVAADVGEEPKLDLGIVRTHQHVSRGGHEGFADLPSLRGADRNVLTKVN